MNVGKQIRGYTPAVQTKREKKKEEIAQVAARLFREKGPSGVSLLDIARRMRLGRTTIYEYFQSKQEILAFSLVREMKTYHRRIADVLGADGSFRNTMEGFFKVQAEYGAMHGSFSHQLRSLESVSPGLARRTKEEIIGLHGEFYRLMTGAIQGAIDRGEVRDIHPGLLMQLLVNATSFPLKGTDLGDCPAQVVLDVFWRGIGKSKENRKP